MAEELKGTQFSHLLQQGSQFVQQRRPDLAIPLLEQAVSIDPQSFDAPLLARRCLRLSPKVAGSG
jgi:hypothetical protein